MHFPRIRRGRWIRENREVNVTEVEKEALNRTSSLRNMDYLYGINEIGGSRERQNSFTLRWAYLFSKLCVCSVVYLKISFLWIGLLISTT